MQADNPYGGSSLPSFGGGETQTAMNPIVMVVLIVVIVLIFVLPRKTVIGPVLLSVILIPVGQQIYIAGVHWMALRIIVLCCVGRVMFTKSESRAGKLAGGLNNVDWAFFGCVVCMMVGFVLQYMDTGALVNQFGVCIDFAGAYFVLRALIQEEQDVYRALQFLAFATLILAIGMVWEQMTLHNVFGQLGGTRAISEIREGKIRSEGSFQHSLTAGVFGATLLPLFVLLWKNGKAKVAGATGLVGCTVMTLCSNSSSPLLAYVAGLFAICLWPIRKNMQTVRRGMVVVLVALHLTMSAPVWFLIARIDLTGSSSGYHRAELVDQLIRHFSDWWLIGTKDSATWGYDMWDQQNQYVNIAETGGLGALVLFITMISRSYTRLGNARKLVNSKEEDWLLWYLGAALFAIVVGFFGVNEFDQAKVGWMMLIAMIIAITTPILHNKVTEQVSPTTEPSERDGVAVAGTGNGGWWGSEV
jgi:hypothetical protein